MKRRDQIIYGTLLHDVGKFMQRAEVPCPGLTNDETQQRVCPFNRATGRFTHLHALWTEQFFEEYGDLFPDVTERFSQPEDNLVNLAAWHHKPSTAAQWIVTEAERMSSGMDRKSRDEDDESSGRHAYKRTHVRSLFARADLQRGPLPQGRWVHTLAPLTPERSAAFPKRVEAEDASLVSEYRKLWGGVEELGGLDRLRTRQALFCRQLL